MPYEIRDLDGTILSKEEGRAIVADRYSVHETIRAQRRAIKRGANRRMKESPGAPSIDSPLQKDTAVPIPT